MKSLPFFPLLFALAGMLSAPLQAQQGSTDPLGIFKIDSEAGTIRGSLWGGVSSFRGDLGSNNLGREIFVSDFDLGPALRFGAGLAIEFQYNALFTARMSYINSRIQGVREDEWISDISVDALSFESSFHDIDLAMGISTSELLNLHRIESYPDFLKNLDILWWLSAGVGIGRPDFYRNNLLDANAISSYTAFFGSLGGELRYKINDEFGVMLGTKLSMYLSDEIEGYVSSTENDAIWHSYLGVSYNLFNISKAQE